MNKQEIFVELQVTLACTLQNHVGVTYQSPAITPGMVGYEFFEAKQAATVSLHVGTDLVKLLHTGQFTGGWYSQDGDDRLVENQLTQAQVSIACRTMSGTTKRAELGVQIPNYEDDMSNAIRLIGGVLRRLTDSLGGGGYVLPDDELGEPRGPDDA